MSLSEIIQDNQTKCFDANGVFFAFSDKQFEEQKKDGVKYASLGAGLLCPVDSVSKFITEHALIVKNGITQDIEQNGKEEIIRRELANHECYYTNDAEDCIEALEGYGFTPEEIIYQLHG